MEEFDVGAVKVVRCKDCTNWEWKGQGTTCGKCHREQWDNDYFYYKTFENDFCSYGEKRYKK